MDNEVRPPAADRKESNSDPVSGEPPLRDTPLGGCPASCSNYSIAASFCGNPQEVSGDVLAKSMNDVAGFFLVNARPAAEAKDHAKGPDVQVIARIEVLDKVERLFDDLVVDQSVAAAAADVERECRGERLRTHQAVRTRLGIEFRVESLANPSNRVL